MSKNFNIGININTGKITLDKRIYVFDTDIKSFNIYVELNDSLNEEKNVIPNASLDEYTVKLFSVKPETQEYFEMQGTKDASRNLVCFDLPNKFNSIVGTYKAEFQVTKGEETVTSDPFEYIVKASVITGLSKDITTQNAKQINILEGLINEVKTLSTLEFGKEEVLSDYQTKEAEGLKTEANDLVGAINEIYEKKNIRVVDDLITTNKELALSSNQGKILNDKISKKADIGHSHKEIDKEINDVKEELALHSHKEIEEMIKKLNDEVLKLKKVISSKSSKGSKISKRK